MSEHAGTGADRDPQGALEARLLRTPELSEQDVADLLDLLQATFPQWPPVEIDVPEIDHLRWRLESPLAGESALVGRVDGELVTSLLYRWLPIRIGGRERIRLDGVDRATHPDHRGRGYATAASRHAVASRPPIEAVMLDYSDVVAVQRILDTFGALPVGASLHVLVAPLAVARLTAEWELFSGRIARATASLGLQGVRLASRLRWGHLSPPAIGVEIRECDVFDERFDALFEAVSPSFDLIGVRDARLLSWRFLDPRAGRYTVLAATAGEDLAGYAVLGREAGKASIVDLLVQPGREDVLCALVSEALSRFRAQGEPGVMCWMPPRHPYYPALRRLGFLDLRRKFEMRYESVGIPDDELAVLQDPETRIHFMQGDTDYV